MIIGFSHVIYNANNSQLVLDNMMALGYRLIKSHLNVASSALKNSFLSRPLELHDIHLLDGPITMEITSYGNATRFESKRILHRGDFLEVQTSNYLADLKFFTEGLGLNQTEGSTLKLSAPFKKWTITLELSNVDSPCTTDFLDSEGLTCLSFISSDIVTDSHRLAGLGAYDLTPLFPILLDTKSMSIVMGRSPGGIMFELIKIENRRHENS